MPRTLERRASGAGGVSPPSNPASFSHFLTCSISILLLFGQCAHYTRFLGHRVSPPTPFCGLRSSTPFIFQGTMTLYAHAFEHRNCVIALACIAAHLRLL